MTIHFPGQDPPSLRGLIDAQRQIRATFGRLASGRRVVSGADDPGNLGPIERLRALEASVSRGIHNLSDGESLTRVADAGLGDISDQLGRMRELAVQARNGTLSSADRDLIQIEYDQLAEEVTRVSKSTTFNGHGLLDGDISGSGALSVTDHTGEGLQLSLEDHSADALGVAGLDVGDAATLDAIDDAAATVSSSRGEVGAIANSIDARIRSNRSMSVHLADARSRIADADFAFELAGLARHRILTTTGLALAAYSQRNSSALLDLIG